MYLAELLDHTGLDVLGHLDRQVAVPVVDGLQAQGDLIVVPRAMTGIDEGTSWWSLPLDGIELVRGEDGNNPHTLVAEHGSCALTTWVPDPESLAIAMVRNAAPVYLVHPEHGATGIAPGCWIVRRQREAGFGFRKAILVAD
jgi:hypothetical protein